MIPNTFEDTHGRIYNQDGSHRTNGFGYNQNYEYEVQFSDDVLSTDIGTWICENTEGGSYVYSVVYQDYRRRKIYRVFELEDDAFKFKMVWGI